MSFPLYIVDAFTTGKNDAFSGNGAAVCLLEFDDDITDVEKQKIAMEMNLSETVFVAEGWARGNPKLENSDPADVPMRRTIRWFTPTIEVPLCGHGTVASSKIIFAKSGIMASNSIEFHSKFSGTLGATIDWATELISLNFPANPPEKIYRENDNNWIQDILTATLGDNFVEDSVQDLQYSISTKILLVRLKDELQEKALLEVCPNFQKLLEIDTGNIDRRILVTVKGTGKGEEPHFYSRFFAPWEGVNEDPVCGTAHTVLTPYWMREYSKEEMGVVVGQRLLAKQSSKRGGHLRCLLEGDRVGISGQARVTVRGELLLSE